MKYKIYAVGDTIILKKNLINNKQYGGMTFWNECYKGDLTIMEVYNWQHQKDTDYRLKNGHIVNRRCVWRAVKGK